MRTWEAGFDGHLVKPVDFDSLTAALKRAFWAHSGQVRFTVSHAATRAKGRPRTHSVKPRESGDGPLLRLVPKPRASTP
jgi:DNA-binding response OmpR family regulator